MITAMADNKCFWKRLTAEDMKARTAALHERMDNGEWQIKERSDKGKKRGYYKGRKSDDKENNVPQDPEGMSGDERPE